MGEPQQRELARSGRGEIDPTARKVTRESQREPKERGRRGKVPEDNRPGHKPNEEQDKPPPG
jgi:hypothetical protein